MSIRANHDKKTFTYGVNVSPADEQLALLYIKAGYTPKESMAKGKKRPKKTDVTNWLRKNHGQEAVEKFEADIKKPTGEKTPKGKDRIQGYLVALSNFKKEYPNAWKEIKESINKEKK